jgi:hypothetical protein
MENNFIEDRHWVHTFSEPQSDDTLKKSTIKFLTKVDDSEYEEYSSDRKIVEAYFHSENLLNAVRINMFELADAVVAHGKEYMETRHMNAQKLDEISADFSRLLLNLMSMFRSLLDHTDTSLTRESGTNSTEYSRWKNCLSNEFDSVFAYRFFYKLRNYAQHVGMPPIGISFSESANEENTTLRLDLSRDLLLEEKDIWSTSIRKELELHAPQIPLLDVLDNWSVSFNRIATELLKIRSNVAKDSAERIFGLRKKLDICDSGSICIGTQFASTNKPGALALNLHHVPEEKARFIIKLQDRPCT